MMAAGGWGGGGGLLDQQGCSWYWHKAHIAVGNSPLTRALHQHQGLYGVQFGLLDRDVSFTPQCALFVCVCASLSSIDRRVNNVLPVDLSIPHLSPCTTTKELETNGINVWASSVFLSRSAWNLLDEDEDATPSTIILTQVPQQKELQASTWS